MNYQHAKKLNKGDQVTIKDTGETVTVIDAWEVTLAGKKVILVELQSHENGWQTLTHIEVE